MKIYKLQHSSDSEVIGVSGQIQTYIGPYDRTGPKSFIHVPLEGGALKPDIEFPILKMENRARKTDWLQCVPLRREYLILSLKSLKVFRQLNVDTFQHFPITVSHGTNNYSYCVFYLQNVKQREFIDWEKSSFV